MFAERSQLAFHTTITIILNLAENKHTGKKKKGPLHDLIFNSTCFTFYFSSLKPSFTFKSKLSHLRVTLQNIFYWPNFHLCCHLQMSVEKLHPSSKEPRSFPMLTSSVWSIHLLKSWTEIEKHQETVVFVGSEVPCYCANPSSSVDHLEIFQRPQCENHASMKSFRLVLPISSIYSELVFKTAVLLRLSLLPP